MTPMHPNMAMKYSPAPTAIPNAAEIQIVVAVVSPVTVSPSLKMTPAPRNPIPVTMVDAIAGEGGLKLMETSVKMVEPRQIMIMVRRPAALLRYSLSNPIAVPIRNENRMRHANSSSKTQFQFTKER